MILEHWMLPFVGGTATGFLFFGGLWYTILQGMRSPHPELWFLASLVLRMSVASGAFVWLSSGRWDRLVACLIGFLMARAVVLFATPLSARFPQLDNAGGTHAIE